MGDGPKRAPNLPKVAPAAWHGPLGEAVNAVAPSTEADPIAILATALALFGSVAGDSAHVRVGGVRHAARVWPLIVGKTGAGRKGTSFAEARRMAQDWSDYSDAYVHHRVVSGLSSGEGLLAALGASADGADPDKAPIAADGKLTVVESEFARVLAAAKRDGSTLGPILRQLWDDGNAAILTRAAPLQIDRAHLGVIAHVTPRELRLRLQEADLSGGTVNRFLLIASERPHLLPHEPDHADIFELSKDLGRALERARSITGELHRDRRCNALWSDVYGALSEDEPDGTLGSVLARGPAYTMRLALVYALADGAGAIACEHLLAGLAVWQYAADTARLLFGDTRRAMEVRRLALFIADALAAGRTRTEVSLFFGRNKSADEIDELLGRLEHTGQITFISEGSSGGRPSTRYRWTGKSSNPVETLLTTYHPS
jgi:hypothetical protein